MKMTRMVISQLAPPSFMGSKGLNLYHRAQQTHLNHIYWNRHIQMHHLSSVS